MIIWQAYVLKNFNYSTIVYVKCYKYQSQFVCKALNNNSWLYEKAIVGKCFWQLSLITHLLLFIVIIVVKRRK